MQISQLKTLTIPNLNDVLPILDIDGGPSGKPILRKATLLSLLALAQNNSNTDLTVLTDRITAVESVNTAQTNNIINLQSQITALGTPASQSSLTALTDRVAALELNSSPSSSSIIYTVISTNTTVSANSKLFINATCTITLPSVASVGNSIELLITSGVTVTLNPNGKNIESTSYTTDYPTIVGLTHLTLIYASVASGWIADISNKILPANVTNKLLTRASWVQLLCSDNTLDFASGSTTNIASWVNAGNGDNAVASAGSYPTLSSSNLPSGKPAIAFSGAQFFTHTALSGRERTIFVVARHLPTSVYDGYFIGSNLSSIFWGYDTGGNSPRLLAGSGGYFSSSPYTNNQNQWRIYELVINSSSQGTLLVNGIQDSSTITISSDLTTNRISGYTSGRNFNGLLGLVAQTNVALSSALRSTIRSDIASWAGITL